MTIIKRQDGQQFVVDVYREVIQWRRRSALLKQLRKLAERYGQYCYYRRKTRRELFTVNAREPGYLLAECVWDYFNRVRNLLFCENIEDGKRLLLVVIREGLIFLDTIISPAELQNELQPIMADSIAYTVVLVGEVPFYQFDLDAKQTRKPILSSHCIESCAEQNESVFNDLPLYEQYRLSTLTLAIKAEQLAFQPFIPAMVILLLTLFATSLWINRNARLFTPKQRPKLAVTKRLVSAWSVYYQAMSTPAPLLAFSELVHEIDQWYSAPAWELRGIEWKNSSYFTLLVVSDGGTLHDLLLWSKQFGYQYQLSESGVRLIKAVDLPGRQPAQQFLPLQPILANMIDAFDLLLRDQSVAIIDTKVHGRIKETKIALRLHEVTPQLLLLLGNVTKGLPVSLNAMQLHFNNHLISGTIQFSVWGA